ncbi:hypothetical protein HETIRDRAFT_102335 [Heterobasidion irregulare TC 32-1]|uniref:Uncharacterized protein n=1 Tax=Heterobasidion irregulare (strain TC 32-1) TaxID=747525 RepID=W4KCY4_HETIT|nr:uncharacterized protein HETIRDRAFT_102335 [Heterobasidion irregulare TC 32-1]ETW83648.1 hypothetical protein HETIRDRAFT_102335 [Heterobasidion irregulare TC 32-1]
MDLSLYSGYDGGRALSNPEPSSGSMPHALPVCFSPSVAPDMGSSFSLLDWLGLAMPRADIRSAQRLSPRRCHSTYSTAWNHGYSVPARKETLLRTSAVSHALLDTSPTRCWIPPPRVVGHLKRAAGHAQTRCWTCSNALLDMLTSVRGNNLDDCTGGGQQSSMMSAVRSQAAVIAVW